jgi:hypothetical protein
MSVSISEKIAHVTGGRRYCFVIMSYHEGFAFFERVRTVISEETGFECIRADDIPGSGEDLRAKIHAAIDAASFVIADVSHLSPNIYYEVGYAVARSKEILVLAKEGIEIPTDLLGVETIRYKESREGWTKFLGQLRKDLATHGGGNVSLVRSMIVPNQPNPSVILASPRAATVRSDFKEHKTYGDYLGVLGILGAFATVYGEHVIPDLLGAQRTPKNIDDWDANLYLIGSDKVNPHVGTFLERIQAGRAPNWRFDPPSGEAKDGDWIVQLSGEMPSGSFGSPVGRTPEKTGDRLHDYGLIVRGAHPDHRNRMVVILGGPHSLGTGAACLAATRTQLVREIRERLQAGAHPVEMDMQNQPFWVLVKGVVAPRQHLGPECIEIVDADGFAT